MEAYFGKALKFGGYRSLREKPSVAGEKGVRMQSAEGKSSARRFFNFLKITHLEFKFNFETTF